MKYANNNVFGDDQIHPNASLPPKHTVEIPTDWIVDPNLKSHDKCILILMLCYATPSLDVQISRSHIARLLNTNRKAVRASTKRLTSLRYIRKLPTADGFTPVFRIYPTRSVQKKKPKSQKG